MPIIVTTTPTIEETPIVAYLGIVTAEVVYGTNALRDFFAGLRDFVGGRTNSYERVFEQGQQDAIAELQKRAARLGADAIVGIRLDTDTINVDREGVLFLITATGTAVKLRAQA